MNFTYLKDYLRFLTQERTPGNAMQVWKNGRPVFSWTGGVTQLADGIPVKEDTLFSIYSCSKVLTVTAAMQLVEQGKILLDDPVGTYLPAYEHLRYRDGGAPVEKPLTVGDLFSMTGGLDYDTNSPGIEKARELTDGRMDTLCVANCIAEDGLLFTPGECWNYSFCHDVLAALVEQLSGMKFRDYVKTHIFEPLEMYDSRYHHTSETLERAAGQYRFVPYGWESFDEWSDRACGCTNQGIYVDIGKENHLVFGPEYDSGGAGVITTVGDYGKFMAALAGGGMGVNGNRILSKRGVSLLATNRLDESQRRSFSWRCLQGFGYGLGVQTHMDPAKSGLLCSLGTFGWPGASGSLAIADPKEELAFFYVQETHNVLQEEHFLRLINLVYAALD